MLTRAHAKCSGLPVTNIEADALNLPFVDETFDVITVAFGLRNLKSAGAGLQEMKRALRPGGIVVILEFSKPVLPVFRQAFSFVVFSFSRARLGRQQATQTSLSTRRRFSSSAISGFSFLDALRVTALHCNVSQAYLCIAVAQVRQLPIVLLSQSGVTVFQGFIGQALIGKTGTTGQADGNRQAQ